MRKPFSTLILTKSVWIIAVAYAECKSNFAHISCNPAPRLSDPRRSLYCNMSNNNFRFWISSNSPLAEAYPQGYENSVKHILNELEYFSKSFHDRQTRNVMTRLCNPSTFRTRRDGSKISKVCFTQRRISRERSNVLWDELGMFKEGSDATAKAIKQNARSSDTYFARKIHCWQSIHTVIETIETGRMFSCTSRSVVGIPIRQSSKYSLLFSLTNSPSTLSLEERERDYLLELWRINRSGKLQALTLSPYFREGNMSYLYNDTTTLLTKSGGQGRGSYLTTTRSKASEIEHVRHLSRRHRESIEDSVMPSNVAILILPAFLYAVVPLSCFEFKFEDIFGFKWKLLIYAIITDVLAVLPLAFKGIEVLKAAQTKHYGCVVRFGDGLGGMMELSCASCAHHARFSNYGIAFLVIAFILLLVGTLIEITGYIIVRNRFRKAKSNKNWWLLSQIVSRSILLRYHDCLDYVSFKSSFVQYLK